MDLKPHITKPISDDQELSKALAGVTTDANPELNFEETPEATATAVNEPAKEATPELATEVPAPTEAPVMPSPIMDQSQMQTQPQQDQPVSGDLPGIKKDAITELRPLVDTLNLAPEEKFDIYLLIIRSTDDKSLIAPAHEAAKNIADEARRAQALLDIIKEIDYLSAPKQ